MKFAKPDGKLEELINELFTEMDRMSLGRYEMKFYSGGRILIDTDAKPPKRRRAA